MNNPSSETLNFIIRAFEDKRTHSADTNKHSIDNDIKSFILVGDFVLKFKIRRKINQNNKKDK